MYGQYIFYIYFSEETREDRFYWSGWSRKRPRNGADGTRDSHTDKRNPLRRPIKRPDLFGDAIEIPKSHPVLLTRIPASDDGHHNNIFGSNMYYIYYI